MLGDVLSHKKVEPASLPTVSAPRSALYTFLILLIVILCI